MRKKSAIFLVLCIVGLCLSGKRYHLYRYHHVPLHDKIGQMIMVGFFGKNTESPNVKKLQALIKEGHIGGIILYDRNIQDKAQLQSLILTLQQSAQTQPLFVAIDQEGGRVSRPNGQEFKKYMSQFDVADRFSTEKAYTYYVDMARSLKALGINVNFAPVVDVVHRGNSSVIAKDKRSFSDDPERVSAYALQHVLAFQNSGVIPVLKHFPGLGSASKDSHFNVVDVSNDWSEIELIPYRDLITKTEVPMIMMGHVSHQGWDNIYPASLSEYVQKTLLRKELRFQGVIVTDDLQMGAITTQFNQREILIQAINSGANILLFNRLIDLKNGTFEDIYDWIASAIKSKELSEAKLTESYRRIVYLKKKYLSEKKSYLLNRSSTDKIRSQ